MDSNLIKLMKQRTSCRSFSSRSVTNSDIEYIVDAALTTASGGDLQPYSIIEIRDQKMKDFIAAKSRNQHFIKKAPVLLVLCIDYNRINKMAQVNPFPEIYKEDHFHLWMSIFNIGLLSQNLTLVGESIGIKSICVGNFFNYMESVGKALKLPKFVLPCMLMCFGYPNSNEKQPNKYKSNHVLHKEVYKDPSFEEVKNSYNDKYGEYCVPLTEDALDLFKLNSKLYGNEIATKYADNLMVGKDKLDFYQFWMGGFFDPLSDSMKYSDYKNYIVKQGFKWLEG